jgi:hypothetical protein
MQSNFVAVIQKSRIFWWGRAVLCTFCFNERRFIPVSLGTEENDVEQCDLAGGSSRNRPDRLVTQAALEVGLIKTRLCTAQ